MDQLTVEQTIWIAGVIACVVLSASYGSYVACTKNRAWYEGFWMGIFLGPFGVIAAACMPTLQPAPASVAAPAEKFKMF
jgi:hypothetical protein